MTNFPWQCSGVFLHGYVFFCGAASTFAKALILVLVQRQPVVEMVVVVVVVVYCVHPNLSKALCLMGALPLCTLCTSNLAIA